ncbi:MAG: hypothetical protein C5B54_11195 [Acidobacteria bacterium]|nr:MAG: hypothetical protein C5B54_11195 [Acidobacteriota bacterium]
MLVNGAENYYRAAARSIRSILKRSPFDVYVACGQQKLSTPASSARIRMKILDTAPSSRRDRAYPFLLKFDAISCCLEDTNAEWLIMLDADTLLATQIQEEDIARVLDGLPIGMVEQTGIRGSSMTRRDFLEHYKNYTLAWFDPGVIVPDLDQFRFFNSGVVLGHRSEFEKIVPWAQSKIRSSKKNHEVGIHMIADQDYLQFWTNTLHPGICQSLPWKWNHCEHWDIDFPRDGAIFYHFSNFCNGPTRKLLFRMAWLDIKARQWNRHANF